MLSILLSLWSGLVFLKFVSMLYVAHTRKSLFESGLNIDEDTEVANDVNLNSSSEVPKMLDRDDIERINTNKYVRPVTVMQD